MSLSSLSGVQLRKLLVLVKEKEALTAKLARVEQSLNTLQSEKPSPKLPTSQFPQQRRRRKAMKGAILMRLATAGKAGLSVNELAESIRARPASVSVWFYTTGKKVKGIQKVGRGRYAFVAK